MMRRTERLYAPGRAVRGAVEGGLTLAIHDDRVWLMLAFFLSTVERDDDVVEPSKSVPVEILWDVLLEIIEWLLFYRFRSRDNQSFL
jgi:hypothetical protein